MPERWELSACIEWLFADGDRPFDQRVFAAAEAGFRRIEFWGARNKDLAPLEAAIRDSGVLVSAILCDPADVEGSCRAAARLNSRNLIVLAGEQPGDLVWQLRRAARIASDYGVGLLLEPLNTVDHPGYVLDSTPKGLDVVRAVDHPAVRLLYDLYHSVVMGEEPERVLAGAGHLVGHVHVADVPGRHEPGTGEVDWPRQLEVLRRAGYSGPLGLEYQPTGSTADSLVYIRELAAG